MQAAAAMRDVREAVASLRGRVAETLARAEELLARQKCDLEARVAFGGFTSPKLLSEDIVIEGARVDRLRIRRVEVGAPVSRSFGAAIGVTRCVTRALDVRELWEGLLAREAQSGDLLYGRPSTVLDLPEGAVSKAGGRRLYVSLGSAAAAGARYAVVCVPRFAHITAPRKLRNFGHWLLDCAPQVAALAAVAPDAVFLFPPPLRPFQRWTAARLGLREPQLATWDGTLVRARRFVVFECDGRIGGGRPLSGLLELRRRLVEEDLPLAARRRWIYVSRRDARPRRRWVLNPSDVEDLFRDRGFEIVSMADYPLDEQVRIFREARVVAGVSGAGLSSLLFSGPGTHVVVLLTDSLVRWYADRRGSRSLWTRGGRGGPGHLAALGDSPRFYVHLAAALGHRCHSLLTDDAVPLDGLSGFLDEVLGSVESPCR